MATIIQDKSSSSNHNGMGEISELFKNIPVAIPERKTDE